MKICIVPEYSKNEYKTAPDEGIEKYSFHIIKELRKIADVYEVKNIKSKSASLKRFLYSRFLLSQKINTNISKIKPDVIFYIPSPIRSLVLLKVGILKYYSRKAKSKIILICLQPFGDNILLKKIFIRFLAPDLIFVQFVKERKRLEKLGCKVKIIPSGVDIRKFTPVSHSTKLELREKYNIASQKFVLLHVGSINQWRNVVIFEKIKRIPDIEIIIVGSTTTYRDMAILKSLKGSGIRVITEYLPEIQEIYQLSDCYIFPVEKEGGSIGMPLSVLEAMACNLTVITTKFGCLSNFFEQEDYFKYVDTSRTIIEQICKIRKTEFSRNRDKVISFSWPKVAQKLLLELFPEYSIAAKDE